MVSSCGVVSGGDEYINKPVKICCTVNNSATSALIAKWLGTYLVILKRVKTDEGHTQDECTLP